jgi:PST family polysaccharide transporter
VLGFALAVKWGMVAVAAAYVFVGYLVSPLYFQMIRSVIPLSFRTYIRQLVPPLVSSVAMIVIVLGLKYVLGEKLGLHLRLLSLVLCGAFTYLLALRLIQPSCYQQLLGFAHQALPSLMSKKA